MTAIFRLLLAAVALALTLGAASAETITLSGEVTYRERIALPPNATLRLVLVDLATPDQPRVHAEGAIATPGQVPLSFTLNFDDGILSGDASLGLRAEILSDGQVWFRNAEPVAIDPAAPTGIEVITNFAGRTEDPAATTPVAVDPEPLFGVNWQAVEIGGNPVTSDQSTLSIGRDLRAGGRGGCNSYFSQAEINGDRIAFSAAGATQMACEESLMAQETAFFDALNSTRFWRMEGDLLVFLDADSDVVLRLERANR